MKQLLKSLGFSNVNNPTFSRPVSFNTMKRTLDGPFPHQLEKGGDFVYGIYGTNTVIAWGGYHIDRALDRQWELANEHHDWKLCSPLNIGIFELADIDLPLEDAKALIELLK